MNQPPKTPAWMNSLIESMAPPDLAEEIMGDLYELWIADVNQRGARVARRRYVINGLGFLTKRFFWKKRVTHQSNSFMMIKSYFTMASRSLIAYKGTTMLNVLGLVVGIAAALVIFTVIRFELSFDAFHTNRDSIYRMVRISGADMSEFRSGISYPVPRAMKEEMPSLKNIVSMEYFGGANVEVLDPSGNAENKFREERGCVLVEPAFFKIFDFEGTGFKWIAGNSEKALVEPLSVVLTRSMAKKYFGDREALGRTLRLQKKFDCKVTGVIEDFPANTDFPFTILLSYSSLTVLAGTDRMNDWTSVNDTHQTYIVLEPGITKEDMEKQISKVHAAHTSKELHEFRHYLLQEFRDLHFDARFGNYSGRTISRQTLTALAIIAAFLLLTASINYINLATAQSSLRAKEIGLRKVMGSNRKALVFQFLTETFVVVCIAAFFALILSEVLLINLQSLLNVRHTSFVFQDGILLFALAAIIGFLTLFSGFYPSLVISRFNPATALKNKFSTETLGGVSLRKVLVVVQFTITQILVVGTFIVVSQMRFFQQVNMGFNKDAIVTVRIPDRNVERLKALENQLRAESFISQVSFSFTLPSGVDRNRSYSDIGRPEASSMKDYVVYEYCPVDESYIDLYQLRLLAGRKLVARDSFRNIVINKTLVKNLQLGTAHDAVGKALKMNGDPVTVVGVIDDFYSNSLKEGVDNIVLFIHPRQYSVMSVKLTTQKGESLTNAVEKIRKMWSSTYPEYVFSYSFLDENIKAFYAQERRYAQLFQLFSLVFLLIGCLGLYGLITFVVNRKSKEVAVRKVMGATVSNILVLFSREYIILVTISFVLAVPVAYYAVNSWLSNFANHVDLNGWLFVLPGFSVLAISLAVVTAKSMAAAFANPVEKLKYE